MRHGAGILGELRGPQVAYRLNPLHGSRVAIAGVLLLTKYGQPFLERELEPIPARDAVARPVVEIFVGHGAIDELEVEVRRDVEARQHQLGVEYVQSLVLHRAGVEIADGDQVVLVQVDFQAIRLFVPCHRVFQRLQGKGGLVLLAGLDEKLQRHLAAGPGHKRVRDLIQFRGDDCEQVRRFGKRVLPGGPVSTAFLFPFGQ